MDLAIVDLTDSCIDKASALIADKYNASRTLIPEVPSGCSDQEQIRREIESALERGLGVAAFHDDTFAGFLTTGFQIPSFHGREAAYVPEWAHGVVDGEDISKIYEAMYAAISTRWAKAGFYSHVLSVLACEKPIMEVFFRFGFGMIVIDALRGLPQIGESEPVNSLYVYSADKSDVEAICLIDEQFQRYLSSPPTFLACKERSSKEAELKWLSNPDHKVWLAIKEDKPIGLIRANPASPHSSFIMRNGKTICITGAYVMPEHRGSGVALLLLQAVLKWAKASGYEGCGVDFESANILGSGFWLRHFKPVVYSLVRHADANCASSYNV